MKRQQDIERILEEFQGVRNIPRIKTAKKRVLITNIKNEKGECITSRKGIADAFGEFYKRLYEDSIPEITTEELLSAISKLKTGKSPDSNGIGAEDIKACDDETREMMRQIFNETIKRNNFTPDEWKKVKIKVIHKKGDVEDVSNYRPICSLPAMYKLFSTILYGRLYPMLDQKQAEDQAGFRKTYQTTDPPCDVQNDGTEMPGVVNQNVDCDGGLHEGFRLHLSQFYLGGTQILQCRSRIRQPLGGKFTKTRRRQYRQTAESESFDIQKGSKQGDPMSSLLFNTVLPYSLKDEIQRWQKKKGMGIYLSDQERDCLTNLRFADDVMLFATSKEQLRNMMYEFKKATEKVGLKIHPDKTKILSNQSQYELEHKKILKSVK